MNAVILFLSCMAHCVAFVSIACLVGCTRPSGPVEQAASGSGPAAQRANPASQHCVEKGGTHTTERSPGGGQYGVCIFPDNRQCEEWALFRGECPPGGIRVTGYATPAARYCAITGGRYTVVARSGAADEQGTCTLPSGKTCDADAYHQGTCGRESPR
jgi:putative hemolysin